MYTDQAHVQQDAHEFLVWLIQELHQEHLRTTFDTAVEQVLGGRLSTLYTCATCKDSFQTHEHFRFLTSPVVQSHVFEPSDHQSDHPCNKCKSKSTKRF